MEKLLNSHDKECMKMAMLKHEETFREQVCELHRLYKIQKLLMKKTEKEKQQVHEQSRLNLGNFISSNPVNDQHKRQRLSLDLERLAEEEYVEDDQTELELTLGPTSQCRRKRILNNMTSDSAASFSSSSSTVSNRIKSSNSGSDQKINTSNDQSLKVHNWSLQMPGSKPLSKDGSEVDEQQLNKQNRSHGNPSWLFQALTLNTSRKNHLQPVL